MSFRHPIIAVAGLACETSTFTPARTEVAAFHPCRGDAVKAYHPFIASGTPLGDAADWRGTLIGHALPGGTVARAAFEELAGEIVSSLRAIVSDGPLDGLWFDIHGAMCVEGLDDAEFELLTRIRSVIGPDVIVSASMDLHGNVSRDLAHQLDLVTCYRTAPHVDVAETRERACRNLVEVLDQSLTSGHPPTRPVKAWIPVPVLLAGEQTSTRVEPAKHIYAAVSEISRRAGVLDASIWVGYAWADEPRNRAAVVVTGWDEPAGAKAAEHLANLFWDSHRDFTFVAPTGSLDDCLDAALNSETSTRPLFISDSGDNPTAGGSGDVTWTLAQLLSRPECINKGGPNLIYASLPAPSAIQRALSAGLGRTITVTAGAEVDATHSGPITLTGTVHAIKHHSQWAETEVVLHLSDSNIFVILTKLRKPYHKEQDFTDLNLLPRRADVVVVKIGYLEPELYDMAKGWMMALTPGGVDQDLERLGHKRVKRPCWPFDKEWKEPPDLRARIIPASNLPLKYKDG